MMTTSCAICASSLEGGLEMCSSCAGLLRWVRGYFAHVPGLAEQITPQTRLFEDLAVESLDWMHWPLEAEEKLGIALPGDRVLVEVRTIGQWLRILRVAGATWPADQDVRLLPRRWWSSYRWVVERVDPEAGEHHPPTRGRSSSVAAGLLGA